MAGWAFSDAAVKPDFFESTWVSPTFLLPGAMSLTMALNENGYIKCPTEQGPA